MSKRSKRKNTTRRENQETNINSKIENKELNNPEQKKVEVVMPKNENGKVQNEKDNSIEMAKKVLEKQVWEWVDKEIEKEETEKKNRENHEFVTTFHRKETDEDFGLDTPRAKKLIEEEEKRQAKEKQEAEAKEKKAREEYLNEVAKVHDTVSKFHSKEEDNTIFDPEDANNIRRNSKKIYNEEKIVVDADNTEIDITGDNNGIDIGQANGVIDIAEDNNKIDIGEKSNIENEKNQLTDMQEQLIDEFRVICYNIQNTTDEFEKAKLRKKLLEKVDEMNLAGVNMKMSDVANLISQDNVSNRINKVVKSTDVVTENVNESNSESNTSENNHNQNDVIPPFEIDSDDNSVIPPFEPSIDEEINTLVPEEQNEEGIKIKFSAETGKYVLTNNGTPLYRVEAKDVLNRPFLKEFRKMLKKTYAKGYKLDYLQYKVVDPAVYTLLDQYDSDLAVKYLKAIYNEKKSLMPCDLEYDLKGLIENDSISNGNWFQRLLLKFKIRDFANINNEQNLDLAKVKNDPAQYSIKTLYNKLIKKDSAKMLPSGDISRVVTPIKVAEPASPEPKPKKPETDIKIGEFISVVDGAVGYADIEKLTPSSKYENSNDSEEIKAYVLSRIAIRSKDGTIKQQNMTGTSLNEIKAKYPDAQIMVNVDWIREKEENGSRKLVMEKDIGWIKESDIQKTQINVNTTPEKVVTTVNKTADDERRIKHMNQYAKNNSSREERSLDD